MSVTHVRRYRVEHQTAYRYEEPVTLSHHQLRLTPRPLPHQHSQAYELALTPVPAYRCQRLDAFGNSVIEIAIESAHSELEIVARSTVELSQREVPPAEKTAPWEAVREALAYRAGWRPDPAVLEATRFLFESPHARVKRVLRAYAGDCFRPGLPLLEAARALMSKIHAEFKFDAEATTVTTPVMKFFEQKRGVCQDFTHFMISCLRSTGLAARYVSGYLMTRSGPARQRPVSADASHAWVALFVPDAVNVFFFPLRDLRARVL
jgi:transglutaminase-like putative cysteine protease